MSKKDTQLAYHLGVWMLGFCFCVLGIALLLQLPSTVLAIRNSVIIPFMPHFVITGLGYLVPILCALGGLSMFIPSARDFGYHSITFVMSLVAVANLFLLKGPNFAGFTWSFAIVGLAMLTYRFEQHP